MVPCDAVAAAEAFLERTLLIARDVGMTERVMPVHVGIAVILVIIARGVDAMAEPVAANVIVSVWEGIPSAALAYYGRGTVGCGWRTVGWPRI